MFVLGVDIGYSNLKLAIGQSGSEPKTIILPAGAGPADRMPERIGGGDDETEELIEDELVEMSVFKLGLDDE